MADDKKTTFPMLPAKHWWVLRKKFKQSIPGTVTDNYIASVLGMEVKSARANVLPYLESLGIIDDDGKTLDRAKQWRDDAQYAQVCKEILKEIYPSELLDAVPNPSVDREAARRWFANHTGAGEVGVRRMIGTYTFLCDADPSGEPETKPAQNGRKPSTPRQGKVKPNAKPMHKTEIEPEETRPKEITPTRPQNDCPELNINLQIHISSDATPDQIDKIFESMAKHIYNRKA